jgi:hypothetical protein
VVGLPVVGLGLPVAGEAEGDTTGDGDACAGLTGGVGETGPVVGTGVAGSKGSSPPGVRVDVGVPVGVAVNVCAGVPVVVGVKVDVEVEVPVDVGVDVNV